MKISLATRPLGTPKILLVDDNRHGLIVRKALLEEVGFAVQTASNGEEGLDLFTVLRVRVQRHVLSGRDRWCMRTGRVDEDPPMCGVSARSRLGRAPLYDYRFGDVCWWSASISV